MTSDTKLVNVKHLHLSQDSDWQNIDTILGYLQETLATALYKRV